MISAGELKKGMVIALEGACWVVEDFRVQQAAKRHSVLHARLRNLKTGHVAERAFNEADRVVQPDLQSRPCGFLFEDQSGYVFMDMETFDQFTVPSEVMGNGRWLLKEGAEFTIRTIDGQPVEVVLPPAFVDEVVETADPASSIHAGNVPKDAKLACGLVVKVPHFIKVGEHVKIDTASHKYHGKESARH
jgi:elongation factor P